jgi:hypothetical protein
MSYTDIVVAGDRLVAQYLDPVTKFGTVTSGFDVVSKDLARCKHTGKTYKLNRRGNNAALFVGNFKVVGRI